jgi:ABC-type transport system substrate-binding protein
VAVNTTRGPLKDARVRQALNHAVDTRTILDRCSPGAARSAAGTIAGAVDSLADDRAPYAYDPAKAKQLLAAAGHANGLDVELWVGQDPRSGASRRACRATCRRWACAPSSCSATRRACARRRAPGAPTSW